MITGVRERLNPGLRLAGNSFCLSDARARQSAKVKQRPVAWFPLRAVDMVICEIIPLAEAFSFGQPIGTYEPRSTAAADYRALATKIPALSSPKQQHGETHNAEA